jgi:hypothetical protein
MLAWLGIDVAWRRHVLKPRPWDAAQLLGNGCIGYQLIHVTISFRWTFAWPEACNAKLWKASAGLLE